jgi:hypothetical protein
MLRSSAFCCTLWIVLAAPSLAQQPGYIGAGGCASSNCHGATSAAPEADSRILGNEYSIWSVNDKHSQAFKVLLEPRSRRMAQILGIADPSTDKKCTSCHAAGSPEKSASDGVACEACHGPAEKWLGPHTQKNSHAASVAAGLIDTKDLTIRAKTCLQCHQGTADRIVDHDLIAAGHPDLAFELDTFSWAQPIHHREPKPSAGNSLPRVRNWAVGQAVAFSEGMRLLATRAGRLWPEFAELECYQCHHDLRADSWRIQRGYPGRRPGSLQLNQARLDIFRVLVGQAASGQRASVDSAIQQVAAVVSSRLGDASGVASAASAAARQGDAVLTALLSADFTPDKARAIVRAILGDINRIAGNGPHSAEQATMALDALSAAYLGNAPAAQQALAELYNYLEHPSTYQSGEFAALFRKVAAKVQ